jgi:hypothetical protein
MAFPFMLPVDMTYTESHSTPPEGTMAENWKTCPGTGSEEQGRGVIRLSTRMTFNLGFVLVDSYVQKTMNVNDKSGHMSHFSPYATHCP